ncbi:MAG: WecB/TagA/CpsF family glycosyltransferase [Isosphaeraceae bacterium]|nr:WecB/TagA/CpsF family glycosyltransferase [Isosphaeraceae bacterium]
MTERVDTPGTQADRRAAQVWVWGLPLTPFTMEEALEETERAIARRQPSLYLSANLNFAMLCDADEEMDPIVDQASMILTDGMPIVWGSRLTRRPVPERVTGSDLIFRLSELAAKKGYRVFLLGGAPGIGERAAANLRARYGPIDFVGIESPSFAASDGPEVDSLIERIRRSNADIMIVAASQPRGEKWLAPKLAAFGVPAVYQIGASLDFAAGRVSRAPRWIQSVGMEWCYRLALEPRRLALRYLRNARFLSRMLVWGPRRVGPRSVARGSVSGRRTWTTHHSVN